MHILLGILGLAAAASFWIWRMRNAADAASEVKDMAETALGAVNRWKFKRTATGNPVDQIEDLTLAQGALASTFLELGPPPTREDRAAHLSALQRHLRIDLPAAEELTGLAHFFGNECGSAEAAVTRIAKRARKLGGDKALDPALAIISDSTSTLTDRQREAVADLKRIFHR